ncbi:unnamed protein product [Amoebophrya sp. A120]|nr:unnamed protein product [Amoebophrya sp. A120]|eukprot:GSA120T00015312001.1
MTNPRNAQRCLGDIFEHFRSFAACDPVFLNQLRDEVATRILPPQTVLIKDGEPPSDVYFLRRGQVRWVLRGCCNEEEWSSRAISTTTRSQWHDNKASGTRDDVHLVGPRGMDRGSALAPRSFRSSSYIVRTLCAGEVFGEVACLLGVRSIGTFMTEGICDIRVLSRKLLLRALKAALRRRVSLDQFPFVLDAKRRLLEAQLACAHAGIRLADTRDADENAFHDPPTGHSTLIKAAKHHRRGFMTKSLGLDVDRGCGGLLRPTVCESDEKHSVASRDISPVEDHYRHNIELGDKLELSSTQTWELEHQPPKPTRPGNCRMLTPTVGTTTAPGQAAAPGTVFARRVVPPQHVFAFSSTIAINCHPVVAVPLQHWSNSMNSSGGSCALPPGGMDMLNTVPEDRLPGRPTSGSSLLQRSRGPRSLQNSAQSSRRTSRGSVSSTTSRTSATGCTIRSPPSEQAKTAADRTRSSDAQAQSHQKESKNRQNPGAAVPRPRVNVTNDAIATNEPKRGVEAACDGLPEILAAEVGVGPDCAAPPASESETDALQMTITSSKKQVQEGIYPLCATSAKAVTVDSCAHSDHADHGKNSSQPTRGTAAVDRTNDATSFIPARHAPISRRKKQAGAGMRRLALSNTAGSMTAPACQTRATPLPPSGKTCEQQIREKRRKFKNLPNKMRKQYWEDTNRNVFGEDHEYSPSPSSRSSREPSGRSTLCPNSLNSSRYNSTKTSREVSRRTSFDLFGLSQRKVAEFSKTMQTRGFSAAPPSCSKTGPSGSFLHYPGTTQLQSESSICESPLQQQQQQHRLNVLHSDREPNVAAGDGMSCEDDSARCAMKDGGSTPGAWTSAMPLISRIDKRAGRKLLSVSSNTADSSLLASSFVTHAHAVAASPSTATQRPCHASHVSSKRSITIRASTNLNKNNYNASASNSSTRRSSVEHCHRAGLGDHQSSNGAGMTSKIMSRKQARFCEEIENDAPSRVASSHARSDASNKAGGKTETRRTKHLSKMMAQQPESCRRLAERWTLPADYRHLQGQRSQGYSSSTKHQTTFVATGCRHRIHDLSAGAPGERSPRARSPRSCTVFANKGKSRSPAPAGAGTVFRECEECVDLDVKHYLLSPILGRRCVDHFEFEDDDAPRAIDRNKF